MTETTEKTAFFAAGGLVDKAAQVLLPKKGKTTNAGAASGATFNPAAPDVLITVPTYRDHLQDIFTTRQASDARTLIKTLMINDPDMSAATNAYLTVANTDVILYVKDVNGAIDRNGQKLLNQILLTLTTRFDYTTGFEIRQTLRTMCESMRYMLLLRGMLSAEMIITKDGIFDQIRQIDPTTLTWYEPVNGYPKPKQVVVGNPVGLDYSTFFVSYFRQDPTSLYSSSPFVSAINTIAARQQVINDLYRIMQITGYPRMEVKVLEEVLIRNAPPLIKADPVKIKQYVTAQLTSIQSAVGSLRPDQAFVHTDSVDTKMLNEGKPGAALNIEPVIKTLNAQNQAGLRAVSTILGRGESGVNTASVEARIFALTAQELNEPIADLLAQIFTMAIRIAGSQSYVHAKFRSVEMRPDLELEPQLTMKASRLKTDLSLGIIDDDEYHLEMYGRLRPDNAPILSGTGFMPGASTATVDVTKVSPNSDPMGRSLTTPGSKAAKGNNVKQ